MKQITLFKIKYNDYCKIIPIPDTLEKLISSIRNSFNISKNNLISLSYIDDENDLISVFDSMDFSNLIKFSKTQNKVVTIKVSREKHIEEINKLNIFEPKKSYFTEEFNKIYNYLLDNLISPFKKDLSSNCLNKNLNFNTRNNNNCFIVNLKLINNGKLNWPNPSFLTCLKHGSGIIGKRVKILKEILPSNSIDVNIKLDLSKINGNGTFISLCQLFDEKGNSFGNVFSISINCIFDNELIIKPEFVEIYYMENDIKSITTDEFLINKGFNIEENFCNNGIKKRDNNSDDINIYNKYYD